MKRDLLFTATLAMAAFLAAFQIGCKKSRCFSCAKILAYHDRSFDSGKIALASRCGAFYVIHHDFRLSCQFLQLLGNLIFGAGHRVAGFLQNFIASALQVGNCCTGFLFDFAKRVRRLLVEVFRTVSNLTTQFGARLGSRQETDYVTNSAAYYETFPKSAHDLCFTSQSS